MRSLRRGMLLSLSALAVLSCAGAITDPGPGKRVEVSIARQDFRAGDSVAINVTNVSHQQLTYPSDFCPKKLQRLDGGSWTDVPLPGGEGCALSVAYLGPLEQLTVFVNLPTDLSSAVYRIALPAPTLHSTDAEPPLLTSQFAVTAA